MLKRKKKTENLFARAVYNHRPRTTDGDRAGIAVGMREK